jgi:hypothetical protein
MTQTTHTDAMLVLPRTGIATTSPGTVANAAARAGHGGQMLASFDVTASAHSGTRCHCCGATYTPRQFVALPSPTNGRHTCEGHLWRRCRCGNTLALPLPSGVCFCCGATDTEVNARGADLCQPCWEAVCVAFDSECFRRGSNLAAVGGAV